MSQTPRTRDRTHTRAWAAAVLFALAGCANNGVGNPPAALTLRTVKWYASAPPPGSVLAVAEADGRVAVFTDQGAFVYSGGVLLGADPTVHAWRSAGAIPAAGQTGTWLVGVDDQGALFRMRGLTTLENISDRYGLAQAPVMELSALGGTYTAFALADGLAVSDGTQVARFSDGTYRGLAGAGGKVAGASTDAVRVLDGATMMGWSYGLAGARFAAFDAAGKLAAASDRALYAEDDNGDLTLRYEAGAEVHGLSAAGTRLWFAEGAELGTYESATVSRSSGANLAADAKLFPASDGNVWVLSNGALTRYASGPVTDQESWSQEMLPVFAQSCTPCHLPGGSADIDLSTYEAWSVRRPLIRQRVVVEHTMPPAGASISDGSRDAVSQWVDATN